MTKYFLHFRELFLEVDDPHLKSWTFKIFLIHILLFKKGQGADREKTDFAAHCFSWWGLLGLQHRAAWWIFKRWVALPRDLPRSVRRGRAADVCGFLRKRPVGAGAAAPLPNLCAQSSAGKGASRRSSGRSGEGREGAGIKW